MYEGEYLDGMQTGQVLPSEHGTHQKVKSKYGTQQTVKANDCTHKTVKARFWPCLAGKSLSNLRSRSLSARKRLFGLHTWPDGSMYEGEYLDGMQTWRALSQLFDAKAGWV